MDAKEARAAQEERLKAHFDKDFLPGADRQAVEVQYRMANAAEYAAHQLFHIRKALEKLADKG